MMLSDIPRLCEEWHPEKNLPASPCDFKAKSNKKAWWVCSGCKLCGRKHEWAAFIHNRTLNEAGCPYCSARGNRVCLCNSVASHPLLAAEFDSQANFPNTAEGVSLGSDQKVVWRCSANVDHGLFSAKPRSRAGRRPSNCPLCAKEILRPGFWHQVCSYVWEAAVKDRALRMTGCPKCKKRKGGMMPRDPTLRAPHEKHDSCSKFQWPCKFVCIFSSSKQDPDSDAQQAERRV